MMNQKFSLQLLKELGDLQKRTGYTTDNDEEILSIAGDSSLSLNDLNKKRASMWLAYSEVLLNEIEDLINYLLINFADVKKINKTFNQLIRRYEQINEDFEKRSTIDSYFEEIQKLFNDIYNLFVDINDDEKISIREGRIRFLTRIYPIYATLFTSVYAAIVGTLKLVNKRFISYVVVGWFLILIFVYFLIKLLSRMGLRRKNMGSDYTE